MARHLRVEFPGAIYHVAIRMLGVWKKEANAIVITFNDRAFYVPSAWMMAGANCSKTGFSSDKRRLLKSQPDMNAASMQWSPLHESRLSR